MNGDSEDATVWQKVKRRRTPVYEGEERRSVHASSGLPYWLVAIVTLVPLITVLGSGFTAYVKRGAVIEQIQEKINRLEDSNKMQWERIGQHLTGHE